MIYDITIPQFTKMLMNLDGILVKATAYAETKKFDMSVLLNSRLAPDQFNLLKQVQIVTDSAKIGVSKLTGKDAPVHDDKETTVEELRARIASTISFLKTITEKDFSGFSEKKVTTPRWENKYLLGHEYVTQHTIPNFYFHIAVAYEILRHNGLDIGKKDYLGAMPFRS